MLSRLTALVGGGSSLPFELLEPFPTAWGAWTHYKATAKTDGSPVSVFKIAATNKSDPKLVAARNGVKRLRTVGAHCWRLSTWGSALIACVVACSTLPS